MSDDDKKYFTFIRTCRNWQQFAQAEKKVVDEDLTYSEAREAAREWNKDRSDSQKEAGTCMEFAEMGYGSNLVYPGEQL